MRITQREKSARSGEEREYQEMILAEQSIIAANLINVNWRTSKSLESMELFNPVTADVLARISLADAGDLSASVDAASTAFPSWRRTPPQERIQYLFRLSVERWPKEWSRKF